MPLSIALPFSCKTQPASHIGNRFAHCIVYGCVLQPQHLLRLAASVLDAAPVGCAHDVQRQKRLAPDPVSNGGEQPCKAKAQGEIEAVRGAGHARVLAHEAKVLSCCHHLRTVGNEVALVGSQPPLLAFTHLYGSGIQNIPWRGYLHVTYLHARSQEGKL